MNIRDKYILTFLFILNSNKIHIISEFEIMLFIYKL
jgi:hypothetical protein